MRPVNGVLNGYNCPLQKNAVYPVLLHPAEMGSYCRAVVTAKQIGRLATGKSKRRLVNSGIFTDIWPKIKFGYTWFEGAILCIVVPAHTGSVARCVEPTLVACHDKPVIAHKRRRVAMPVLTITVVDYKYRQQKAGYFSCHT